MSNPYDTIVDGTSIDAAMAATGSALIKSGTYSSDATITIDQDNMLVRVEPGATINANTGGIVISGSNCQIEFGPGCTVDNNASAAALSITISGTDNSLIFRNGCTIGNINITSTGDRTYIDGGGLGTVADSVYIAGDDCILQRMSVDSKTPGTGLSGVFVDGGNGRAQIMYVRVIDSNGHGIALIDFDCLVIGCVVTAADSAGIRADSNRTRVIGNHITASTGDGISVSSAGDNSIISANMVVTGLISNASASENVVIVANRTSSPIEDDSTTSVVMLNNEGTSSCSVTGTLQSAGATESDIVTGGKTLILTLTNSTWRNMPAADLATAFQALLTGDQDGNTSGWDDEKATILASGTVVRTSSTVMTITLAAAATYDIAAGETVALANLDTTVLESGNGITPDDVSYSITTV